MPKCLVGVGLEWSSAPLINYCMEPLFPNYFLFMIENRKTLLTLRSAEEAGLELRRGEMPHTLFNYLFFFKFLHPRHFVITLFCYCWRIILSYFFCYFLFYFFWLALHIYHNHNQPSPQLRWRLL